MRRGRKREKAEGEGKDRKTLTFQKPLSTLLVDGYSFLLHNRPDGCFIWAEMRARICRTTVGNNSDI